MPKNPYRTNPNYLSNPADSLYSAEQINEADHIQDLIDEATSLEDRIAGEFEIEELVNKIKINTLSYIKNGLIAFKIKTLKLYKNTHFTFKEFCETQLGLSTWQVNRNIKASKVCLELATNGFDILPQNEAQARSLLTYGCEDIIAAWRSVVNNLLPHQITARSIADHLKPEKEETVPKEERIIVNRDLFNRIFTVALSLGTTIEQLLEQIFQPKQNCANYYYEEKVEQWQNDLENLIAKNQTE